jgi:hypothetical protein
MTPPRELNPNHRASWPTKAKAVAGYRQVCGWAAKVGLEPGERDAWGGTEPVTLDIAIAWTWRGRPLDDDNARAMCKSLVDGISDVLWGGEDAHVRIGRVTQETGGKGEVAITIRRDEAS